MTWDFSELYRIVWSVYFYTIRGPVLRAAAYGLLFTLYFVIGLLCFSATSSPCLALESQLSDFLAKVPASELVPGSDHYGPIEGAPPVVKAFAGQKLVGYAFVNADWVNSTGYSGQPIQILVGLTTDGKIAGARLMAHHEPIVLIGIPPGAHRQVHPGLCRARRPEAQPRGAVGAPGGGHRQRRHGDGDSDRRKHGALGDARGPRRGDRRPGARSNPQWSARDRSLARGAGRLARPPRRRLGAAFEPLRSAT